MLRRISPGGAETQVLLKHMPLCANVYQLEFVAVFCVFRKPCFVESGGRRLRRRRRERLFESKAAGETKAAPGGRVKFMVPGAGFEPAHPIKGTSTSS